MSHSKKSKLTAAAMASAAPELYSDESFDGIEEDLLRAATEQAEKRACVTATKGVAADVDDDVQEPERMEAPVAPAAAAAAGEAHSSAGFVTAGRAPAGPVSSALTVVEFDDECLEPIDDGNGKPTVDFMSKFYAFAKVMTPLYNRGVLTTNPDLALYVWDKAGRHNLHILGFTDLQKAIIISKTEQKRTNDKGEKVKTDKSFVNVTTKAPQRFLEGRLPNYRFHAMTPFGTNAFMKWGPTKATGVEGHRGKMIKGNIVKDEAAQYQFQITNKSFSHLQQDGDYNNPVATKFIDDMNTLDAVILDKVLANDEMIPHIRLQYKKAGTAMTLKDYIKMAKLYKVIEGEDENDPTAKSRGFAVSVFKAINRDFATGEFTEDPADTPPPSDLFETMNVDKHGNPLVHNRIPLYRCRRADEVEAGKTYDSPFIPVPWDNAELGYNDVFATVFYSTFYEWQYDKCGRTNKPIAFIWLNTKTALESMDRSAIQPCDPRYAIPMAGHYKGPKDRLLLKSA